jgi:hypothetical protein
MPLILFSIFSYVVVVVVVSDRTDLQEAFHSLYTGCLTIKWDLI